jgi:DNA-binding HxlR family transcriptional regulator
MTRTDKTYDCAAGCPVEAALDLIDGKWKGVILYHLCEGTLRFNELRRRLGAITQRMLTKQLRELEADALITRKIYPQVPPKVEYSLSEDGESMRPVIRALELWGRHRLERNKAAANAHGGASRTGATRMASAGAASATAHPNHVSETT